MTITEQTLTHEEMLHLRDLGLDTSDASLVKIFFSENDGCPVAYYNVYEDNEGFYTVDEYEGDKLDVYLDFFYSDSGSYDHSEKDENQVYTLSDILGKLPDSIRNCWLFIVNNENKLLYAQDYYDLDDDALACFEGENLLEAAYKMLCWVVENGYIK